MVVMVVYIVAVVRTDTDYSLFAMLAIAVLVTFIVYRLTQSWAVGQAGALVFMLCPVVTYWVPFHRVDCLAVCFSLAAYAACGPRLGKLLSQRRPERRRVNQARKFP